MANFGQEQKKDNNYLVLKKTLSSDEIKSRFEAMLGKKAPGFISSLLNVVGNNKLLANADPASIIRAAATAATLDLPIVPSFGFAHIVPYCGEAQFQVGTRGYKQLAIRTGQYKFINTMDVCEGELVKRNRLTGECVFSFIEDDSVRAEKKIIGYVNYFQLSNGYESTLYMSMDELMKHAERYSKLYQNDLKNKTHYSKWSQPEELEFMCAKTVTKLNLSRNGILSVEMMTAIRADQATVQTDNPEDPNAFNYVDGTDDNIFDLKPPETDKKEADQ